MLLLKIASVCLLLFAQTLGMAQDCYNCLQSQSFSQPKVPTWPIEFTHVEEINYERNSRASFCKRPVEMIDTIILHHSETPSIDTPERINQLHLSRGTPDDPWYMIAYSYTLNSPYPGGNVPLTRVVEGRPIDIVGAHAGTGIFVPMDEVQKRLWAEGKVICGKENGEFKVEPRLVKEDKITANVTTIGLVVIGNYAPFSLINPNGYSKKNPRYPTKATQDLVARLSCQLQKKHPRIRNIKWHNFYHSTNCPGTIKQYVGQIKALARKYGCSFN